jgi:hypothetical protein
MAKKLLLLCSVKIITINTAHMNLLDVQFFYLISSLNFLKQNYIVYPYKFINLKPLKNFMVSSSSGFKNQHQLQRQKQRLTTENQLRQPQKQRQRQLTTRRRQLITQQRQLTIRQQRPLARQQSRQRQSLPKAKATKRNGRSSSLWLLFCRLSSWLEFY